MSPREQDSGFGESLERRGLQEMKGKHWMFRDGYYSEWFERYIEDGKTETRKAVHSETLCR